jgi:hypothetical protein
MAEELINHFNGSKESRDESPWQPESELSERSWFYREQMIDEWDEFWIDHNEIASQVWSKDGYALGNYPRIALGMALEGVSCDYEHGLLYFSETDRSPTRFSVWQRKAPIHMAQSHVPTVPFSRQSKNPRLGSEEHLDFFNKNSGI